MNKIKVTTRARNLGYGWTSAAVRDPRGGMRIARVDAPDVVGGLRTVERERDRALRNVSGGTHWAEALFLGDRCIARGGDVREALADLRDFGEALVTVAE